MAALNNPIAIGRPTDRLPIASFRNSIYSSLSRPTDRPTDRPSSFQHVPDPELSLRVRRSRSVGRSVGRMGGADGWTDDASALSAHAHQLPSSGRRTQRSGSLQNDSPPSDIVMPLARSLACLASVQTEGEVIKRPRRRSRGRPTAEGSIFSGGAVKLCKWSLAGANKAGVLYTYIR